MRLLVGGAVFSITANGFGLGAVAKRQPMRGAIAAKPVLVAGGFIYHKI